jgi:hypothetical protein
VTEIPTATLDVLVQTILAGGSPREVLITAYLLGKFDGQAEMALIAQSVVKDAMKEASLAA